MNRSGRHPDRCRSYTKSGMAFLHGERSHICMYKKDKSKLVLCVDDELVGLKVRKIVLERAGYRVLTAPDGPSGLSIFAEHPVEAVVLDYSMPGMHGGDVAKRMRETKPEIPILLLSAYVGLSIDIISLVDLYMTKGEGAPVLLEKLGSLLHRTDSSQEPSNTRGL